MRFLLPLCAVGLMIAAGAALAQPPGTPVPGCVIASPFVVDEQPDQPGVPEHTLWAFPCPVAQGCVVLLENTTGAPNDPHNWSDVLIFTNLSQPPQPGAPTTTAVYISDTEDAAGNSNGITDADLAAAGLPFPVALLASLPNIYIPESATSVDNLYPTPPGPTGQLVYDLRSDPVEQPTPTGTVTWGHLKAHYH